MSNKIVLISLEGCSSCSKVRKLFKDSSIEFSEVSCSKDPGLCDELESYTKSTIYPVVIVKNIYSNMNYIYYISTNKDDFNKELSVKDNLVLIPAITSEDVFNKVKNKVNDI